MKKEERFGCILQCVVRSTNKRLVGRVSPDVPAFVQQAYARNNKKLYKKCTNMYLISPSGLCVLIVPKCPKEAAKELLLLWEHLLHLPLFVS